LLLNHICWPRGAKLVESLNLQMAVDISIQQS